MLHYTVCSLGLPRIRHSTLLYVSIWWWWWFDDDDDGGGGGDDGRDDDDDDDDDDGNDEMMMFLMKPKFCFLFPLFDVPLENLWKMTAIANLSDARHHVFS